MSSSQREPSDSSSLPLKTATLENENARSEQQPHSSSRKILRSLRHLRQTAALATASLSGGSLGDNGRAVESGKVPAGEHFTTSVVHSVSDQSGPYQSASANAARRSGYDSQRSKPQHSRGASLDWAASTLSRRRPFFAASSEDHELQSQQTEDFRRMGALSSGGSTLVQSSSQDSTLYPQSTRSSYSNGLSARVLSYPQTMGGATGIYSTEEKLSVDTSLKKLTASVFGTVGVSGSEQYVVEVDNGTRQWVVYHTSHDFKVLRKKVTQLLSRYTSLTPSFWLIPSISSLSSHTSPLYPHGMSREGKRYREVFSAATRAVAYYEEFKEQCQRLKRDIKSERFPGYQWLLKESSVTAVFPPTPTSSVMAGITPASGISKSTVEDKEAEHNIYTFSIFLHVLMLRVEHIHSLYQSLVEYRKSRLYAGGRSEDGSISSSPSNPAFLKHGVYSANAFIIPGVQEEDFGEGKQKKKAAHKRSRSLMDTVNRRFELVEIVKEFLEVKADETEKEYLVFRHIRETLATSKSDEERNRVRKRSSSDTIGLASPYSLSSSSTFSTTHSTPHHPRRPFREYSFTESLSARNKQALSFWEERMSSSQAPPTETISNTKTHSFLLDSLYDGETALYERGFDGYDIDVIFRVLLRCVQRASINRPDVRSIASRSLPMPSPPTSQQNLLEDQSEIVSSTLQTPENVNQESTPAASNTITGHTSVQTESNPQVPFLSHPKYVITHPDIIDEIFYKLSDELDRVNAEAALCLNSILRPSVDEYGFDFESFQRQQQKDSERAGIKDRTENFEAKSEENVHAEEARELEEDLRYILAKIMINAWEMAHEGADSEKTISATSSQSPATPALNVAEGEDDGRLSFREAQSRGEVPDSDEEDDDIELKQMLERTRRSSIAETHKQQVLSEDEDQGEEEGEKSTDDNENDDDDEE